MNATTQATDLQSAIAALAAAHGTPDVLRAVAASLLSQADQADSEADDWHAGDDDWQVATGGLWEQQAVDLRLWSEQIETEADKIEDERIDLERRLEELAE